MPQNLEIYDPFQTPEDIEQLYDPVRERLGGSIIQGGLDRAVSQINTRNEPFRRATAPLDLSFLDPIEEREREALGAVDVQAGFQRRRAAKGITRSFGRTGSRTPGVRAKTLADLISGSIEGQATRRGNLVLGQEGRRAGIQAADVAGNKGFQQNIAMARFQADLELAVQEAMKSGGLSLGALVDIGSRIGAAVLSRGGTEVARTVQN